MTTNQSISPVSAALVAAQMILIVLVAGPLSGLAPKSLLQLLGLAVLLGGLVMAAIAFIDMRNTRFSVLPEPREGGQLVRDGLYGHVRHPMYTAVMLFAVGATLAHSDVKHVVLSIVLLAVLLIKIVREERFLMARYPAYANYRREVKALIPGFV